MNGNQQTVQKFTYFGVSMLTVHGLYILYVYIYISRMLVYMYM